MVSSIFINVIAIIMKRLFATIASAALCLSLLIGVASIAHAQTAGCFAGNAYDIYTGAACTATAASVPGCTPGNTYSTVTGALCPATAATGCAAGNVYNTATGALCPAAPALPNTGGMPVTNLVVLTGVALVLMGGTVYALKRVSATR
jgi:hypothetical protein